MSIAAAFFFFKQKTAYEMVSCDWSSDVCSSDLGGVLPLEGALLLRPREPRDPGDAARRLRQLPTPHSRQVPRRPVRLSREHRSRAAAQRARPGEEAEARRVRHDELLDSLQARRAARAA